MPPQLFFGAMYNWALIRQATYPTSISAQLKGCLEQSLLHRF